MSELIQVIKTMTARGCGITFCAEPEHDHAASCLPAGRFLACNKGLHRHEAFRWVTQYFATDGILLAEVDPLPKEKAQR